MTETKVGVRGSPVRGDTETEDDPTGLGNSRTKGLLTRRIVDRGPTHRPSGVRPDWSHGERSQPGGSSRISDSRRGRRDGQSDQTSEISLGTEPGWLLVGRVQSRKGVSGIDDHQLRIALLDRVAPAGVPRPVRRSHLLYRVRGSYESPVSSSCTPVRTRADPGRPVCAGTRTPLNMQEDHKRVPYPDRGSD